MATFWQAKDKMPQCSTDRVTYQNGKNVGLTEILVVSCWMTTVVDGEQIQISVNPRPNPFNNLMGHPVAGAKEAVGLGDRLTRD